MAGHGEKDELGKFLNRKIWYDPLMLAEITAPSTAQADQSAMSSSPNSSSQKPPPSPSHVSDSSTISNAAVNFNGSHDAKISNVSINHAEVDVTIPPTTPSAAEVPAILSGATESVELSEQQLVNAPDSNIVTNASPTEAASIPLPATKSVEALEKELIDAIRAAKADPTFPWIIQDVAPGHSIRGLKLITQIMERIAQPQDPNGLHEGDFVWNVVVEPTTDRDVLQRSRGNILHTDYGVFVIKLRPGIIVKKKAQHCIVAEIGRRGDRVLDGLSPVELIERMGVLPLDIGRFSRAALSEDDELYRLIYEPLRIAEHSGPGKRLRQCSVVQLFRLHSCDYNDQLVRGGRLATESFSRLRATIDIADQLEIELSGMNTEARFRDLKAKPINRRPREVLSGFRLRSYENSMDLLEVLRRKAQEYVASPANNLRTPDGRGDTAANLLNQVNVDPMGQPVPNDTIATAQTSGSPTATSMTNFVGTTSIHPDRRGVQSAPTLIQAIEKESRMAWEYASKQLVAPLLAAHDTAWMGWEEVVRDRDIAGNDSASKKRKLDEALKLHNEAKTKSTGTMDVFREIKRLKRSERLALSPEENLRDEALRLYTKLDSVTAEMEKLQAKSTKFLDGN